MRRGVGAVMDAAVLAVLLPPAGAQEFQTPTTEELAAVTERGRMLYEYDQAAWHSTDSVQTANPKTVEGQHCIARTVNGKWTVVFGKLHAEDSRFEITYEASEQATLRDFAVSKEPEKFVDR